MSNVIIVGCGVVGSNLKEELSALKPDVYDKFKPERCAGSWGDHHDFAFICVDTPYGEDGECDTSAVYDALAENDADVYVIKSTVYVGFVDEAIAKTGKRIVFSPEYYGGTQHCNNFEFDFTIVGGEKQDAVKVVQLLQDVYDARHEFHIVPSKAAELAKYMENSWLATKVTFCISFYEMAEKAGVEYEELRELFNLDPRVNPAHTFVYRDHPYYKSHCLDKDVPAIVCQFGDPLLKSVIEINKNRRSDALSVGQ